MDAGSGAFSTQWEYSVRMTSLVFLFQVMNIESRISKCVFGSSQHSSRPFGDVLTASSTFFPSRTARIVSTCPGILFSSPINGYGHSQRSVSCVWTFFPSIATIVFPPDTLYDSGNSDFACLHSHRKRLVWDSRIVILPARCNGPGDDGSFELFPASQQSSVTRIVVAAASGDVKCSGAPSAPGTMMVSTLAKLSTF